MFKKVSEKTAEKSLVSLQESLESVFRKLLKKSSGKSWVTLQKSIQQSLVDFFRGVFKEILEEF